jgi:predicted SAM-dependent methyltransferase
MKIEFGCGEKPTKKEFKTCDIRDVPGVDYVCPAWEIEKFVQPNTVDEIFSRHMFEHLTFIQGEKVLEAWLNILKPGGIMEMKLPNMTFHINQWNTRSDIKHAKAGFWGWQREGETEVWDVHKSGYDIQMLKELLIEKGYTNIRSLTNPMHRELHVVCNKP